MLIINITKHFQQNDYDENESNNDSAFLHINAPPISTYESKRVTDYVITCT